MVKVGTQSVLEACQQERIVVGQQTVSSVFVVIFFSIGFLDGVQILGFDLLLNTLSAKHVAVIRSSLVLLLHRVVKRIMLRAVFRVLSLNTEN